MESRQVSADVNNKHDSDVSITEKGTKPIYELKTTLSRINHIYLSLPYSHLPHLHEKILKEHTGGGNKREQVNSG